MGKVSLTDIRNRIGQPLSTFRWSLLFITQPPMVDGIISPDDMNVRCESIDLPEYEYKTQVVKIRQYQITRNSVLVPKPVTFKVIESNNNIVFNFFSSWQKAIFDARDGTSNNKTDLSCIINLTLLDNGNNPLRNFVMFGCNMIDYKRSKLDSSGTEPMKADITIAWERVEETSVDLVSGIQMVGTIVDSLTQGKVPDYLKF